MEYQVSAKEQLYFGLKLVSTIVIIGIVCFFASKYSKLLVILPIIGMYAAFIALFFFLRNVMLVGFLRGSCVRVSKEQFPEINMLVEEHSQRLGLHKAPPVYILQAGGVLNAFATRFFGKDYVAILSDVLEAAYENGQEAVSFIIGHELGHVKRKHMSINFWLFPSYLIPFLQGAYSRACEYTCDSIGHWLSPKGSINGMLILSVGKKLYSKVNISSYLSDCAQQGGFWVWFSEIISSHPYYPKRIKQFQEKPV